MAPQLLSASSRYRGALFVASAGFFVVMLDTTIVNVALPVIGRGLSASLQGLQWVVNAYAIAVAALLLGAGALGDLVGARRVYAVSLMLFALASLGCALSPSLWILLACRFVQGVAGACMIPMSMVLATVGCTSPQQRSIALGWWGSAGGLAAALGPVIGGTLVSTVGWRSIFFVNLPVCALILVAALVILPDTRGNTSAPTRSFDGVGQLLSVVAIGLTSLVIIEAGGAHTRVLSAVLFILAGGGWWMFIRHQRRSSHGFLDLELLKQPVFAVNCVIGWILNFALFGELFVLSMYLQETLGLSGTHAGWVIFPQTCSALVAAPLGGKCAATWGRRATIVAGLVLGAVGFVGINLFVLTGSIIVLAVVSFLASFGMAFVMPVVSAQAIDSVPDQRKGMASGLINTARQVGTVCGTAVMGAICAIVGLRLGMQISVSLAGLLFLGGAIASRQSASRRGCDQHTSERH